MVTDKDIKQYKHLVYSIVNKYRTRTFKYKTHIDWDEMEQVGMIALYNAIKNFNPNNGASFLHYASTAIWRAILRQEKFDREVETHSDIDCFWDISDDKQENNFNTIDMDLIRNKAIKIVKKLNIPDRSKDILISRLNGDTLSEIASRYNVTYQRVSDIIFDHKDKIKKKLLRGELE